MHLIRQANLYTPDPAGIQDILIGGGKILAIAPHIDPNQLPGDVAVLRADGMIAAPGFIDGHQHFTGGGGEGGFESRTPEMTLEMNTRNGVTTAVGLLGTDSLTRTVDNLFAKTRAFHNEGITAFMLTGAYWHPSPSITGSAARDLVYIPPVIGVKLALADIRGPHMTLDDLARLAADIRVASLVADKPGFITVHTGAKPERLNLLLRAVEELGVRADAFIPTHINRKDPDLIAQIRQLAEAGGFVDATCMPRVPDKSSPYLSAADFAAEIRAAGCFDRVLWSSDAGGSMPKWNEDRSRIIGMDVAAPDSLLFELKRLVSDLGMPLEQALRPLTLHPAEAYGLSGRKGRLAAGADADILIMDPDRFAIRDVMARGRIMVQKGEVTIPGYFG